MVVWASSTRWPSYPLFFFDLVFLFPVLSFIPVCYPVTVMSDSPFLFFNSFVWLMNVLSTFKLFFSWFAARCFLQSFHTDCTLCVSEGVQVASAWELKITSSSSHSQWGRCTKWNVCCGVGSCQPHAEYWSPGRRGKFDAAPAHQCLLQLPLRATLCGFFLMRSCDENTSRSWPMASPKWKEMEHRLTNQQSPPPAGSFFFKKKPGLPPPPPSTENYCSLNGFLALEGVKKMCFQDISASNCSGSKKIWTKCIF